MGEGFWAERMGIVVQGSAMRFHCSRALSLGLKMLDSGLRVQPETRWSRAEGHGKFCYFGITPAVGPQRLLLWQTVQRM